MTGRPPALNDIDNLDISPVPLGPILAAGRGIRRRRRRTLTVAAAVAVVAVGGGVFATDQFENGNVARDPVAADGAENPVAANLAVVVGLNELTGQESDDVRGSARWDAASETVVYESRDSYSGSCPPTGTATATRQTVNLVLEEDTFFTACTADARVMTATITGLTTPPTQLVVTENGAPLTVPVADGNLELPCDPGDQLPTELDPAGPARETPLEAVAQGADGNFVVEESGDSAVVHEVGADGRVSRTYNVSRYDDGWLPDGWVECSRDPVQRSTGTPSATVPPGEAPPTGPEAVAGTEAPDTAAVDAASAFVSFAQGGTTPVPWADSIRFTIASTPVTDLSRQDAADPGAWAGCPTEPFNYQGTYEGRDCPVSPLTTIQGAVPEGPVVFENQSPLCQP